MGKRSRLPDRDANLLLTSGLILLICFILAALAYFAFALEIIAPPGASDAPDRTGVSDHHNSGYASPDGATDLPQQEEPGEEGDAAPSQIIYPHYADFSITGGLHTVEMKNDSANGVALSFQIEDSAGQVLYSALYLQPGETESWDVAERFDPGTGDHEVTITITASDLETEETVGQIVSQFTVNMG